MAAFAALGIRSVYDLRTEAERSAQPDRLPPGTEYVVADVVADLVNAAPAQLFKVATDPQAAEALLGGGKGLALFAKAYREIVSLPSAGVAYHRLFSDLTLEEHRPALFHCTGGKDRTGWAAASLLTLLGVPDDLVMQEYLLTNTELLPAEQPLLDRFKALGGDPEVLRPAVAVAPEYLQAALDEMRTTFGSIEGYFSQGLGLEEAAQQSLLSAFVEGG